MNILMVSLGCDKNLCDSEAMLGLLAKHNYNITNDEQEADAIIVNTCSFIKDAMEESVNTVLEMAKLKQQNLKYLIVTGCMAQRFKDEIFDEIPEIDACLGTSSFDKILDVIEELKARDGIEDAEEISVYDDIDRLATITESNKVITSGTFMGYLKIAGGCDKFCTYCVIPHIRGHYRSVPMEQLLKEAEYMASQGIEELVLVAQETTVYGTDIYGKKSLHILLKELCKIKGIRWIRVLYCYPEEIDEALIKEIASNPKIVKYLDIPLQHVHNDILKSMNRRSSFEEICELFKYLRTEIPDISIRSTFICGFPGEQTKHFLTLKSFIEKQKLENVGFFAYSPEEGTVAALMKERISEKVTQHRLQKLAKCQQKVVRILNKRHVGKVYEVLIDDFCELDSKKNLLIYKGRTYFQTPEVDGVVYIESENELVIGEFYDVAITDFKDYDLRGEVAK